MVTFVALEVVTQGLMKSPTMEPPSMVIGPVGVPSVLSNSR